MGRERSSMEDYERADSYTSPNESRTRSRSPIHHRASSSAHNGRVLGSSRSRRSPRREDQFRRTNSCSRQRSNSSEEHKSRYEGNVKLTKPAYGGPKEPLVLDSNIQISVNSKRSCSPVRPNSTSRVVTVRLRGERKSRNSGSSDRDRYERDAKRPNSFVRNTSRRNIIEREGSYGKFSRHERDYESPLSNRRKFSPFRRRRENRNRSLENRNRKNEPRKNSRFDIHERNRLRDRRRNSSRDRRFEKSRVGEGSIRSSRRNEYDDKSARERNSSKSNRRRYSRDSRQESDDYSHSSRKESYEESEKSQHEDELEVSENEDNEEALKPTSAPVALGIRPPMWAPMLPFRPHPPMFLPPRPPIIPPPMGYVLPPRPRFFPFPRPPPGIYFPPRPLPPPPTY